jgi:hypothetical protein
MSPIVLNYVDESNEQISIDSYPIFKKAINKCIADSRREGLDKVTLRLIVS